MNKVMISTAAVALAFGLTPFAGAQTADNGSAAADDPFEGDREDEDR